MDLEEATSAEVALLKKWKQYRIAVNRIQDQSGYPSSIEWPVEPI
ncbi:tail fiber assembly protein [Pseudomonas syringae]